MVDTQTVEVDTKATQREIKALETRANVMREILDELPTEEAAKIRPTYEGLLAQIQEKETLIKQSFPQFKVVGELESLAMDYVAGVHRVFETAGLTMEKFPTPREDGTVRNAPALPGLGRRRKVSGADPDSPNGEVYDLSGLKATISHKFRGQEEAVVGHIQTDAVEELDGKVVGSVKASTMLNTLYHTEDGTGWYAALKSASESGIVGSPMVLLTTKTGAKIRAKEQEQGETPEPEVGKARKQQKAAA